MNNDWTDEELRAAVDVYVEMLQKHNSNKPFTKSIIMKSFIVNMDARRNLLSIGCRIYPMSCH